MSSQSGIIEALLKNRASVAKHIYRYVSMGEECTAKQNSERAEGSRIGNTGLAPSWKAAGVSKRAE